MDKIICKKCGEPFESLYYILMVTGYKHLTAVCKYDGRIQIPFIPDLPIPTYNSKKLLKQKEQPSLFE